MSILDRLGLVDSSALPMYNTGTLLDVATGKYILCSDGIFRLVGGISSMFGVGGRAKNFKSTITNSYVINAVARYPGSEAFIIDFENSIVGSKDRLLEMSTLYLDDPIKREKHLEELDKRVIVIGLDQCAYLDSFTDDILRKIVKAKQENLKEYIRPTPFMNMKTGELKNFITPTFIVLDSFSQSGFSKIDENSNNKSVEDSSLNMTDAQSNKLKARILNSLPRLSSKLGIYFVFTAQITDSISTNTFDRKPKKNPFMKMDTTYRHVSASYFYLISTQIGLTSPKKLASKNESDYVLQDNTSESELFSVKNTIESIKGGNGSGGQFNVVVSQNQGYSNGLSNFIYLKEHDGFGLGTNKINPRCDLYPDVVLSKKKAVNVLADYKTARAVELVSQLCYIQHTWTLNNTNVNFSITPEQLYEKLLKTSHKIEDILETRGWWTWTDCDLHKERDYLSLYGLLQLIT